jgi:hypothetical protein
VKKLKLALDLFNCEFRLSMGEYQIPGYEAVTECKECSGEFFEHAVRY